MGNQITKARDCNTYEDAISRQPWNVRKETFHTSVPASFSLPRTRCPFISNYGFGSGASGGSLNDYFNRLGKKQKLPKESIDSYEDLRTAFRENYLQQTKHIKDPAEIHHIKQRDGESTEDFMENIICRSPGRRRSPECVGKLLHSVTAREKHLHHGNRQRGEQTKFQERLQKQTTRPDRKPDRFSLLTKTPKEIFALEKGKFKAPPPMVTQVEKRDPNKYCKFHADTGHSTDECMQLRKQIDEMTKAGKLSQFIKDLKQNDSERPKKGDGIRERG
ncbi:hypothetical protein Tco_0914206 [Tanacetum coccineum]